MRGEGHGLPRVFHVHPIEEKPVTFRWQHEAGGRKLRLIVESDDSTHSWVIGQRQTPQKTAKALRSLAELLDPLPGAITPETPSQALHDLSQRRERAPVPMVRVHERVELPADLAHLVVSGGSGPVQGGGSSFLAEDDEYDGVPFADEMDLSQALGLFDGE